MKRELLLVFMFIFVLILISHSVNAVYPQKVSIAENWCYFHYRDCHTTISGYDGNLGDNNWWDSCGSWSTVGDEATSIIPLSGCGIYETIRLCRYTEGTSPNQCAGINPCGGCVQFDEGNAFLNDHLYYVEWVNHYPSDYSQASCNDYDKIWVGNACCDSGDTFASGSQLCDGGTVRTCKSIDDPLGTIRNKYFCSPAGTWDYYGDIEVCNESESSFGILSADDSYFGFIAEDNVNMCTSDGIGWSNILATQESFLIRSISNPLSGYFDMISNGNNWFSCSADTANQYPPPNSFEGVNLDAPQAGDFEFDEEEVVLGTPPISENENTGLALVSQDELLQGIAQEVITTESNIISTVVQQGSLSSIVTFNILPSEIKRLQNIYLTISGIDMLLRNDTGYKILVSNEGKQIPVKSYSNASSDETKKLGPIEIVLPQNLELGPHTLNVTLVVKNSPIIRIGSFVLETADKPSFTMIDEPIITSPDPLLVNPERFLCHKQGGTESNIMSSIAECCGPDYRYCINDDINSVRISGGPTGLLEDYIGAQSGNTVLRVNFEKRGSDTFTNTISPEYRYVKYNLPISKWEIYDYLEFDILYLGTTRLNLSIQTSDDKQLLGSSIIKFSTTGSELNKWHHIRIPLTDEMKTKNMTSLKFYAKGLELNNDYYTLPTVKPTLLNANGVTVSQFMIFFIDKLYLSSSDTTYCTTDLDKYGEGVSKIGRWTDNLDDDAADACNNVASFKWTGTQCCGDDNGKFNDDFPDGFETYNDIEGGCWRGMFIPNNTIISTEAVLIE